MSGIEPSTDGDQPQDARSLAELGLKDPSALSLADIQVLCAALLSCHEADEDVILRSPVRTKD